MDTLKILAVDDEKTHLLAMSNSLSFIKNWVNEFLEITITTKNFEEAKLIDVNNYDILFVDMLNKNDPQFWGDHLLQYWNTNNVRGDKFLAKVCLFTNFTERRREMMTLKPELQRIKLQEVKNYSTTRIAEIIHDNFMNPYWLSIKDIGLKLAELMTSLSSKKIVDTSTDNLFRKPNKNLIYITSKTPKRKLKTTIVSAVHELFTEKKSFPVYHFFADGNIVERKVADTKEFNKSFQSKEAQRYYAEIFYLAKITNKDFEKRNKPDYKAVLNGIVQNYETNPKLYFRFDRFIINFRFVTLEGFTLKDNKSVKVALQLPRGEILQVAIEDADSEIVRLLNLLVCKSHETFA